MKQINIKKHNANSFAATRCIMLINSIDYDSKTAFYDMTKAYEHSKQTINDDMDMLAVSIAFSVASARLFEYHLIKKIKQIIYDNSNYFSSSTAMCSRN